MEKIKIVFLIILFSMNKIQAQIQEGSFMPESGNYIVSGWIKEDQAGRTPLNYTESSINVILNNEQNVAIVSNAIYTTGAIIDGWQRALGIIEIPSINKVDVYSIKIELNCSSTQYDCYFDDIRFYPYNGNMKSFVYDEDTKRLMAELDENNYATFYEYDLEGGLVRVKKETERGVMTIQETRSSSKKQ